MNKKGFTLVEIMAVIIIISVIALVGVTSVAGVRRQMDRKLFEDKLSSAISSAEKWGEDNKEELTHNITIRVKDGDETVEKTVKGTELTIGSLIANGYYESEEAVNPNLYNGYVCNSTDKTDPKGYKDGDLCKNVITNNIDNLIVNDLKINVYTRNKRIYACIVKDNTLIVDPDKYSSELFC